MTIGVFDSGRGAYFVAERLQNLFPTDDFRIITDEEHVPYGDRSPEEIVKLVDNALQPLLDECEIIILACNTATAVAIEWLRDEYPVHKFIGFEPMVKTCAELSSTGSAIILATRATRLSERYKQLVKNYGQDVSVHEPNTDGWAKMIEDGNSESISLSEVTETAQAESADIVALACTHYLELQDRLQSLLPNIKVIEPTRAIARQLASLLESSPQQ